MFRDKTEIKPGGGQRWFHHQDDMSPALMSCPQHGQVRAVACTDYKVRIRQVMGGVRPRAEKARTDSALSRQANFKYTTTYNARQGGCQALALGIMSGLAIGDPPESNGLVMDAQTGNRLFLQYKIRAAVGTFRLAGIFYRQVYPRMRIPQTHLR